MRAVQSCFFIILILLSNMNIAADEDRFIPLSLRCGVSAKGFPGIPDTQGEIRKDVALENRNGLAGGAKLVDRLGTYEFWVEVDKTIRGRGRTEILSYNLKIRNMKSHVSLVARSDSNEKMRDGASKGAVLSLIRNTTSRLDFHCAHLGPREPSERLLLSH